MAKTTKKGQKFISKEISHLMKEGPSKGPQKGRKFSQKQSIAVAISVAKKKGYKTGNPPEKDESAESIFDAVLTEKELTTTAREHIAPENFAIPEKAPGSGSYPIPDLAHGRNALARVSANGTAEEKERVQRAVYAKFPVLKERNREPEECSTIFGSLLDESTRRSLFDEFVVGGVAEDNDAIIEKLARASVLSEELAKFRADIVGK
jgi:hypothetical protein